MGKQTDDLEMIRQARLGNRDSMSRLAETARGKVFVYLYRVTLNYHLAQDLSQETILEMLKSLPRLKIDGASLFWSWLYRTALGKFQHHFRCQGDRRVEQKTVFSDAELLDHIGKDDQSGLEALLRKELSQVVFKAMSGMRIAHRNVLTLRCFNDMSYAQIAAVMGVSEIQARLQFFRAKQSLKKQLAESGYKKEYLLPALGLFGTITGFSVKSAAAAAPVGPAAMDIGVPAAALGVATSKTGILMIAAALMAVSAGVATVAARKEIAVYPPPSRMLSGPAAAAVFESPSRLLFAADPDNNGWKAAHHLKPTEPAVPIRPEDLLLGHRKRSFADLAVILPQGHTLVFRFSGEVANSQGTSICYEGRITGKLPRLVVGDGVSREVEVTSAPSVENLENGYQLIGYDIANLPYKPRTVVLTGVDNAGPWGGVELSGVWARLSR